MDLKRPVPFWGRVFLCVGRMGAWGGTYGGVRTGVHTEKAFVKMTTKIGEKLVALYETPKK